MIKEESAQETEKPRRYEVRDAETGEKLSGVSFILTPTGEEMHLLTEPGHWVGPFNDIGVYYHGHTTNEEFGNDSLPLVKPLALAWMARRIIKELRDYRPEKKSKHYRIMQDIKAIGELSTRTWEKYTEDNAAFVAQTEREWEERLERTREKAHGHSKSD